MTKILNSNQMDDILFHEMFRDPPTKYEKINKKIKLDSKGKLIEKDVNYLTANIFYDGTHWAIKSKVVNFAKEWMMQHIQEIPKIEKCKIEITYHFPTDNFDLDNKVYFWTKILLDLMKTPSSKQIINAEKYDNEIKTINVLKDDTVRFVDEINMKYKKGYPAIELKIIGRLEQTQQSLF
jgi:hypothetical protein